METKGKKVKVAYVEPADYFPKETRKMFKLGEYAEKEYLLKYISYYEYDFKEEAVYIADGDESSKAYNLYREMVTQRCEDLEQKWALDIALDCVRNMTDKERELIQKQGEIADYHFGYGMYVRNHYVHPSKKHFVVMADDVSSTVEDFIYAILIEEENA